MASGFNGMRVVAFEDQRGEALRALIAQCGGVPRVFPAQAHANAFEDAIRTILDGDVDVVLFTQTSQVDDLFHAAERDGVGRVLRDECRQAAIGSIGPECTEALRARHVSVEFEPDHLTVDALVRGMARLSEYLVMKKRAAVDAGIDTGQWRRIDMAWPMAEAHYEAAMNAVFIRACRREPTPYTPVWLLRQAGRYQRAYRALKGDVDFLDMCKTPSLTAEITLMAVERLDTDAAILFADILPILQPMGLKLEFVRDRGPVIHNPVRSGAAVDQLAEANPETMSFVYEAIRIVRRALRPTLPLIGFAGAPFTLAAYAIEGGASKNFEHVKTFMYRDPGAWRALMEKFARAVTGYLNRQIEAGVQAVQVFDSWVGCLSPDDYREFVLPYSGYVFSHLTPGVPTIHFGLNTAALLGLMREAGGDVIGLDWRVDLAQAWERMDGVAVQGNLDPVTLFAPVSEIRKRARAILHKAGGRPGHIFNVGHGILPGTPEDHVTALVDAVHEYGER